MQSAAEPLIQPAEKAAEWWRGAVVYHVYPLSFADADGDGTGDLAGVCDKLDYIASLGVDMVWISPFYRSPMRDFGYDVADYCDVDPLFGSLADFDALVAKAHRLGLKVVIDLVFSHTSDEHDWFKQSRQSRDKRTGMSGPTRSLTEGRRTIGRRFSADPAGPGTRAASNIICIISCPPSPT
jgi:alpha-glucosidase